VPAQGDDVQEPAAEEVATKFFPPTPLHHHHHLLSFHLHRLTNHPVHLNHKMQKGRNIVDMDQDEGIELVADQAQDAKVEGRHVDKQAEI
nr:hypothetical protein [Tanacetum cinerariifolium]